LINHHAQSYFKFHKRVILRKQYNALQKEVEILRQLMLNLKRLVPTNGHLQPVANEASELFYKISTKEDSPLNEYTLWILEAEAFMNEQNEIHPKNYTLVHIGPFHNSAFPVGRHPTHGAIISK